MTPDRNTAPSATGQATPSPLTTVYVKYAFSPMPGECNRISRERAHHDASERGRQTCRGNHGSERHARFGENGRVHEDDVCHRHEGREPGENLRTPIGAESLEFEVLLQTPLQTAAPSSHDEMPRAR